MPMIPFLKVFGVLNLLVKKFKRGSSRSGDAVVNDITV